MSETREPYIEQTVASLVEMFPYACGLEVINFKIN